ncbi:MAG: hypothetical protein J6E29_06095 [Prevotella sp.]|nr:hypothetical protein [Prevotella sp.]
MKNLLRLFVIRKEQAVFRASKGNLCVTSATVVTDALMRREKTLHPMANAVHM